MNQVQRHRNIRTQLQGQAGVWSVAAQLAIRGHIPIFPGVDYGYDIMLENGLRIQIKTTRLVGRNRGRYGSYPSYVFNIRKTAMNATRKMTSVIRDWSKYADFFVLWGIDENRFWIIPTTSVTGNAISFNAGTPLPDNLKMKGGLNPQYKRSIERRTAYENRWDLLDVDASVEQIVTETSDKEFK